MFKIYDESQTPNEGACLSYMMNRNRQMRKRGYMMDPNRQRRVFKIYDDSESPTEGACSRHVMSPNHRMRASAEDMMTVIAK